MAVLAIPLLGSCLLFSKVLYHAAVVRVNDDSKDSSGQ